MWRSQGRGGELHQLAVEQHELRRVRQSVPRERTAVFGGALPHPVHSSDDAVPRQRVRQPTNEQDQLRILWRDLRKSPLRERRVRVHRSLHELRRHLHEPHDRRQQLRNVRHDLRGTLDVPERRMPVADWLAARTG